MSRLATNPLVQLTLWRVREFTREGEALFWVFAFPILLAFALGLAFKSRGPEVVRIAVEQGSGAVELVEALSSGERIEAVLLEPQEAYSRLRTGRVALVVKPGEPVVLQYDSTRSEGNSARMVIGDALQEAAGRRDVLEIRDVRVTEPGARYIDFLIPGLLGLNIMGTGMWGVGFGIVKSRTHKLLKRFLASPMRKSDFMLAFMLARLAFLGVEVAAVLAFGYFVFGVPVRGSILAIAAIVLLGAMTFSGLGLLTASRSKTIEGISGLLNVVMVPMWICSGVFFAYSHFPDAVQPFIRALPLTALNDALRMVLLDGAPLLATAGFLGVLALWGVGSFGLALGIFRWH
ncbi:MAG: ABC transporter permease [Gemmatimonadales bacterium]|nr:ABC transporter permease [Gemmatimonadales bacterium]NIN13348.1 ABC transporter permease [Gemmatimonadales bacterium]NIN51351.1 ABC transporter permease [Gemmatimonadales bacterium]NIP08815.1 ABC transporter permease [Gemmatimonadales bacterium]NIQ99809.1 ABC transporter permease [Gemmatimonadales bacterium]